MTETCANCIHWREQSRPADPRTGAVAIDPDAPRMGNCFRNPPQLLALPTAQGMAVQSVYPPLPDGYPACDQFTARPPVNGQPDPETVTAWWNESLHKLAEARQRGEAFLADCLMQDLDARLRQAEQAERAAVINCLLEVVAIAGQAQTLQAVADALRGKEPPSSSP